MEILDSAGKLVRKYSSTDQPDMTEEQLKNRLIPLYWIRPHRVLETDAGMHRWVWDLHYPDPISTQHGYPIAAIPGDTPREPQGPHALPGKYSARLTVNGHSYTEPFSVEMDPRVRITAAGLMQMFQVESRVASLLTRTSQSVMEARSMRTQAQGLQAKATGPAAEALKSFDQKIASVLQSAGPAAAAQAPTLSKVNGAASSLYADATRADAAPTKALLDATATAEQDATAVLKAFGTIKTVDLPTLNQSLRGANLPEIRGTTDSKTGDDDSDVE